MKWLWKQKNTPRSPSKEEILEQYGSALEAFAKMPREQFGRMQVSTFIYLLYNMVQDIAKAELERRKS